MSRLGIILSTSVTIWRPLSGCRGFCQRKFFRSAVKSAERLLLAAPRASISTRRRGRDPPLCLVSAVAIEIDEKSTVSTQLYYSCFCLDWSRCQSLCRLIPRLAKRDPWYQSISARRRPPTWRAYRNPVIAEESRSQDFSIRRKCLLPDRCAEDVPARAPISAAVPWNRR